MDGGTVEYVVLQATVHDLVREDLEVDLNRYARTGYRVIFAERDYVLMERKVPETERPSEE